MNAYKCDFCGGYFENVKRSILFPEKLAENAPHVGAYWTEPIYAHDCCDKCYEQIRNTIRHCQLIGSAKW